MEYDFSTLVKRDKMNSVKWAQMYSWNPDVEEDSVPLSVADMELKNPPEIIQGLQTFLEEAILGYTFAGKSFKDAVMKWMKRRHDWEIQEDWIVNTPGVVLALANSVRTFTNPGEGVIIFSPVYHPFSMVVENNNRKLVVSPLIEENLYYRMDFDNFAELAKNPNNKLVLLCSPHNPVGRVWTEEELKRFANICIENDLIVVSDEIHHDLILPGYEHTVLDKAAPALRNRLITCTAPSKTFNLAGMHISNIIIPNSELREKYNKLLFSMAISGANILAYKACEIAYNECELWLNQLIGLIDTNQHVVRNFFEAHFPKIKAPLLEGTYLQWIDFRALEMSDEELEDFMHHEAQFFTNEGYVFGEAGIGFERVNLALPTEVLKVQLKHLKNALDKVYKI